MPDEPSLISRPLGIRHHSSRTRAVEVQRKRNTTTRRAHDLDPACREVRIHVLPYIAGSRESAEYERLQHRVYFHYGADRAKRTGDTRMRSCSHLILARVAGGDLVGGMRIHRRALGPLPVEAALPHSRKLCELLQELPKLIELSGAVVCFEVRKTGLSTKLMRTGVAMIPLLGCNTAVGFGHQHVLPLYARFGMVPDGRLPISRYPDRRYQSQVIVLRDALSLADVHPVERRRIRALRRYLLPRASSTGRPGGREAPGVRDIRSTHSDLLPRGAHL